MARPEIPRSKIYQKKQQQKLKTQQQFFEKDDKCINILSKLYSPTTITHHAIKGLHT